MQRLIIARSGGTRMHTINPNKALGVLEITDDGEKLDQVGDIKKPAGPPFDWGPLWFVAGVTASTLVRLT